MRVPARLGLAVAAAGIGLGTMLGAAANPVMKMPAEQPWQGALQAPVLADAGYSIQVEAPPQDLSPYQDSYAPTWAREELTDWEPEYPAWTYSEFADEPLGNTLAAEDASIDAQQVASEDPELGWWLLHLGQLLLGHGAPEIDPDALVEQRRAAIVIARDEVGRPPERPLLLLVLILAVAEGHVRHRAAAP